MPDLMHHDPAAFRPLTRTEVETVVDGAKAVLQLIRELPVSRLRLSYGPLVLEVDCTAPAPAGSGSPADAGQAEARSDHRTVEVTAPLVGVFYRRPAPDQPPFVEVGQLVKSGQQLAIIEAMKMMNPIVADQAGVVTEIHADETEIVEFGQPLMTLEPA